jgi:hypothetical protein
LERAFSNAFNPIGDRPIDLLRHRKGAVICKTGFCHSGEEHRGRDDLALQLRIEARPAMSRASLCVVPDARIDPVEDELSCARPHEDDVGAQVQGCLGGDVTAR